MIHEPATTLTNFLLTAQCVLFAVLTARTARATQAGPPGFAFVLFFVSTAVAAFFGGVVHGFFPDPASRAGVFLWAATMLSIGVSSVAIALVAIGLGLSETRAAKLRPLIPLLFLVYAGYVLFVDHEFYVAIAAYVPATLVLFAVFVRRWMECRAPAAALGMAGIAVALGGAVAQLARVEVHPEYFDYNAVYHVIQAVAFYLLFRAADSWMREPGESA